MSALQGGNTYGTNSLAQCHQVCHCEEAAGRRGNLAVPDQITGKPSAKTQLPSRDCHVGRWPPRNDTSGKREVRQRPHAVELPSTRRSLSAATPQTSVHAILTMPCTSRRFTAGPGCPLPYSTPRPAGFFSLYHIPREKSTLSEKSGLSP